MKNKKKKEPLIFCAIDTNDLDLACDLSSRIAPITGGIKLGLEFFNSFGSAGIERVINTYPDMQLFIDLKFHDIPNTVAGAVRAICKNFAPNYLNVHASGGLDMMIAAKQACSKNTKLLAVTILTSLDENAINKIGYKPDVSDRVKQLALLTKEAGLDGVVCSSHEISALRAICGDDFSLIVPGIRPKNSENNDQKRIMTPTNALKAGATHLVIGRPITNAPDPAIAAKNILDNL